MGNKPRIRFKDFTEDWEQRKLTDIAKTFIGLVTTMTENYRDSGTLLIRNSDIKEGQFIFSEKPIHLDEEFAEKNKTRRLQIGDVVTVHTGDIGTSAVIQEKEAGAIGFATINTRTDKRILNPYFLSTYFNTEKHKCYANSVSTGDGRANYNIKDFNKLVISIPTLDEQEKISVLINNINTIITLHQCKLEKLKLTKKALLQKLFSKNGKHIPEIRFKGFTDAWEQRKLIYIFNDFIVPMRDKPKVFSGTTPWTRIEDIEGRYINTSLSGQFVSDETIKSMNLKVIPKGSLIVSASATFGVVAIVNNDLITNQTFIGLVPNKDFDIDFLYSLFEAPTTKDKLLKLSAGSTIFYIARESFENLVLSVPSKEEQIKISKVFKSIDDSITLHQRKLERLQEVKKGLLQKMFV